MFAKIIFTFFKLRILFPLWPSNMSGNCLSITFSQKSFIENLNNSPTYQPSQWIFSWLSSQPWYRKRKGKENMVGGISIEIGVAMSIILPFYSVCSVFSIWPTTCSSRYHAHRNLLISSCAGLFTSTSLDSAATTRAFQVCFLTCDVFDYRLEPAQNSSPLIVIRYLSPSVDFFSPSSTLNKSRNSRFCRCFSRGLYTYLISPRSIDGKLLN